jgi:hypothetical protein
MAFFIEVRRSIANYIHYRATPKNKETAEKLRAEKLKAETEKIKLQTRIASGDLLDAQQVKAEWAQAGADLRSSILAIPSRLGAALGLDRAAVAQLDAELREALAGVANLIAVVPERDTFEAVAEASPPQSDPEPQPEPEPVRPARRDVLGPRHDAPETPQAADSRRRAARKAARAARRASGRPA